VRVAQALAASRSAIRSDNTWPAEPS
jgi:hypothetical protein